MSKSNVFILLIVCFSLRFCTSLKTFETILMSYDNSVRPVIHGPVVVNVSIGITSLEINDAKHTLKICAVLQQVWQDIHLRYPSIHGKSSIGLQGDRWAKMKHHLWLPDIDFAGNFYAERPVTGDFLKIEDNGRMIWSQKIIAEFPCKFDFTKYPFDETKCSLKLHSVGYDYKELNARWSIDEAVHHKKIMVYPRYKVKDVAITSTTVVHMYRTQRQLEAKLVFESRRGWAVKHTVLPFIVAVLTAYLSFYINIRGIVARLVICGSALMFALVFHEMTYRDSPKVYYIMAVEVFTSSCFTFIWIAIAETVIIDLLGRAPPKLNSHHSFGDERSELEDSASSNRGYVVAMWVDRCFRIIYPAIFLIFNAIFWIVYH